MTPAIQLQNRTKRFAVDEFLLCRRLPREGGGQIIRYQLMRSAMSVAANYRAACRAHSKPSFIAKLSIDEEEADESLFWLELLEELTTANRTEIANLKNEAQQLLRIMVASKKSARHSKRR
jgi:four helix bundle protein